MAKPAKTVVNVISCMSYRDPNAAIEWLATAFGFTPHAVHRDDAGVVAHAQLTFGAGMIMIGPHNKSEFSQRFMAMPAEASNRCTQAVYVIVDDVDAHHAQAVASGAEILIPPKDVDYGGRNYTARDPEGHVWSFGSYDPWAAKKAE